MDFASVNWLAVLACMILNMLVGMIWYHPKVFFPVWWKGIGKADSDLAGARANMGMTYGLAILAAFVQALFLSLMVSALGRLMPGGPSLATGAATGALVWLGFVAPTSLVNKLFAGHGLKVWAIEAGNHLVNFVLIGAILGAWR